MTLTLRAVLVGVVLTLTAGGGVGYLAANPGLPASPPPGGSSSITAVRTLIDRMDTAATQPRDTWPGMLAPIADPGAVAVLTAYMTDLDRIAGRLGQSWRLAPEEIRLLQDGPDLVVITVAVSVTIGRESATDPVWTVRLVPHHAGPAWWIAHVHILDYPPGSVMGPTSAYPT